MTYGLKQLEGSIYTFLLGSGQEWDSGDYHVLHSATVSFRNRGKSCCCKVWLPVSWILQTYLCFPVPSRMPPQHLFQLFFSFCALCLVKVRRALWGADLSVPLPCSNSGSPEPWSWGNPTRFRVFSSVLLFRIWPPVSFTQGLGYLSSAVSDESRWVSLSSRKEASLFWIWVHFQHSFCS